MPTPPFDPPGVGPPAYDLVVPSSVAFGAGRFAEVGPIAARYGRRAWVVSGSRSLTGCGGRDGVEVHEGDAERLVHHGFPVGGFDQAGKAL